MARNDLYDSALERQGLTYEYYDNLPLSDIDEVASMSNQVRLEEPINQELVDQYAESITELCQFPPLVVHRSPIRKNKYIIDDGNHRFKAMKKVGKTHVDVYILHTEDRMILDRVRGTFNNMVNGLRLSPEESLHHAADYCRRYEVSAVQVCKLFTGIKHQTLTNYIRVQEGREKLAQMGIKPQPTVTDAHVMNTVPLIKVDENLFGRTIKAIGHTGATVADTQDLVRSINKAGTIEAKNKVVDEFVESPIAKERCAETKGGTVKTAKNTLRHQMETQLRAMQKLVEDHDYAAITPNPAVFDNYKKMAESIVHHLSQIFMSPKKNG